MVKNVLLGIKYASDEAIDFKMGFLEALRSLFGTLLCNHDPYVNLTLIVVVIIISGSDSYAVERLNIKKSEILDT